MRLIRGAALFALVLVAPLVSDCSPDTPVAEPPVIPCDSATAASAMDAFAAAEVGVYLDASGPELVPVKADLERYLTTMWGSPVAVVSGPPDGSRRVALWLSTSAAAAAQIGAPVSGGYAMRRSDEGANVTLLVYAEDALGLSWAAYAMLEELGARFFHPKEELVPAFGAPHVPHTLALTRRPWVAARGLQPHVLHPIDWFAPFMVPGAANLADAEAFIDWLAKTGQNRVQLPLLSTVPWDAWKPHMQALIDYAHGRGVKIGAVPEVWGGSSLQNNFVLIHDATDWQAEMDAGLARLMELSWDTVELTLGEFVSSSPQEVIDWLDYATAQLLTLRPELEVSVSNHVGNYPQLWVTYQGESVFYYHLPQFADPRLGQSVHTVAFFDLYRDWGTYGHPDFHLQHDYLMQEVATRDVNYFPESAYWISADIDVPLFLPMYWYARWLDIHTLAEELTSAGLPPLHGHTEFMSGHEWGYWMTDYLVAKMLWEPERSLDELVARLVGPFGSCAADVAGALSSYVALQNEYLFDARLAAYVQGENSTVDLGYLVGLETHPKRVAYEEVVAMSPPERQAFDAAVVAKLEAFAARSQPIEEALAARCRGSDATLRPWCEELWDGVAIVRLRASHAALLYRAVLSYAAGDAVAAGELLAESAEIDAQAAAVVAHRAGGYRFDVEALVGAYPNPTVYPYGYLRQAHLLCYFTRNEAQVRFLFDNGAGASVFALPTCG